MPERQDQEGLIPPALDARNYGEHGGSPVLLLHGPEERFLAGEDVGESPPVHCLHHGKHGCVQVPPHAVWAVQHTHHVSEVDAELSG